MLVFDAHLDLAMNALEWNRDLRQSLEEIRGRETGQTDKPDRGNGVVCFPEMRRGRVGLCVATLIARYVKPGAALPGWHSPEQAWAQTQGQLAWYRAMEDAGELAAMRTRGDLARQLALWEGTPPNLDENRGREPLPANGGLPLPRPFGRGEGWGEGFQVHGKNPAANQPIGYLLSLEGADSLVTLRHLERAYEYGLRAVGPAHYGPGVYAQGTNATGGLGARGRELLAEMDRLGMILDTTHLCDDSFWEALSIFKGPVWASHSNCRALVPHERQFSDDQIKALLERGAVIGAAFDAWMIIPNWVRGESTPANTGLKLDRILEHTDHICQLAGNARHVGLGSDLDGGYGREQMPLDVTSIADLQLLPELLRKRHYAEEDVAGVMHGNFLRFLREALPV